MESRKTVTADTTDHQQLSIADYLSILKRYWGYDGFRGIQQEIIESISSGHDTLGLMPTGGGKSITFQVPALAMEGTCIVITPLIALMKDQVFNLRRRGIKAAAIYSGMKHDDILTTLENAIFGQVKLLYISPERLASEFFRTKLSHMRVSFITVDEAHCISQWGYDFRPSYLHIADIRHMLPNVPVLALTATATPTVVEDIQEKLTPQTTGHKPQGFNVFRMSFERKNLAYIVRRANDKNEELVHLLSHVEGCAIVYARSRRRTKEVSDLLNASGISSTFYHAGLETVVKDERQKAWVADQVRVMVATNAFGMGIDKPDVRLVIHIDCPDSIEAYFQEAGRAGRDGKKSYAILLYNENDHGKLLKRISDTFPEKDYVRKVYDHLAYYYQVATGSGYNRMFEFNIDDFCQKFHHFPVQVMSALQILYRANYLEYIEEQEAQARVMFCLSRDDLYRLEHTDPLEERVITALLRGYGSLFVDYTYIDETFIARQVSITRPQLYLVLKGLAARRIIRFIPQKLTPYIRYMQRREDSEHLIFPPETYGMLKERYADRIHAMIRYASTDDQCRSRQLLRYFGEEQSKDCHQCDVCLNGQALADTCPEGLSAEEQIRQLLSDGQPHHVTQLRSIPLPLEQIDAALTLMMEEETIAQCDGYLSLTSSS
ncbi:MAG: RecQ family ATP-dependent DNA helicase [Prevotella sp.]|nr:RecQ family ATP-dependent DNA helicase [Prevotella sp.]